MMRKLLAGAALCAALLSAYAQQLPFRPINTTNLVVTASAQNLTLPTDLSGSGSVQYVLTAIGTQTVFCRSDGTTATVANGMPFISNSQVVLTLPSSVTVLSCIAGSTGSTLYATVGVGQ